MSEILRPAGNRQLLKLKGGRTSVSLPAFFQAYRVVMVEAKLRMSTFMGKTTRKKTITRY